MTNDELFLWLNSDTKFNNARKLFRSMSGLIEQQNVQNTSPVIITKIEFEAIEKILALYDINPTEIERLPQTDPLPPPQLRRVDKGTT